MRAFPLATLVVLSLALGSLAPTTALAEDHPKLAPFSAVRWKGEEAEVEVSGRWYALRAVAGVSLEDLVAHARTTYGDKWEKRVEEDLVEVLAGMGQRPGVTVTLRVRDLETGTETTLPDVPMTKENRRRLRDARAARAAGLGGGASGAGSPAPGAPPRVAREHATGVADEHRFLLVRHESGRRLDAVAAAEDLDQLEWLIEHRFSYAKRLGVDTRAVLDAIRSGLGDGITKGALSIQLQKAIALYGDGHSGVDGYEGDLPRGFAPFLVEHAAQGPVAYRADRSGLLDDVRPYLVAIDGVPVARWVDAAARAVARGAPHFVRHRALRGLRGIAWLRAETGLPPSATVKVEVSRAGGKDPKTLDLPLADRRPVFGEWPRTATRTLPGNVGYLRLASMDGEREFLEGLVAAMESLRGTKGLVVDVRGNGGGSRRALQVLFPYFLRPQDPPRVANVAAYRLGPGEPPDEPEGYLANRFLHPLAWSGWPSASRQAVDAVAKAFRPEWVPPAGEFSAWHYFALDRGTDARAFSYEKPVVVLQDSACFSATDVFLGALKGLRRVTLLGTPSGGGSGRKESHRLWNSGITVELSTMASYLPDGTLYDGRGVEPDVRLEPEPGDFVGRGDSVLEAALLRLR
jgi:hypothetical protein